MGLKVINVSIVKSNQNELFILYLINMALTERILQYNSIYSNSVSRENNVCVLLARASTGACSPGL